MRIYQDNTNSKIFFKKYYSFLVSQKKIFLKFLLFLILGGIFFMPLGLRRNNSKYIQYSAKAFEQVLGIFDKKYAFLSKEFFLMADNLFGISYRYLKSKTVKSDLLELNLSFNNYEKISNLRNEAIKNGMLVRSNQDKVKGNFTYQGKKYPITLRLKGDWTDHLLGDKWSFRVEIREGKKFLGMSEFSLQHPRTRNYINEFIFHELLKYEKLPFLRYKFIPITLNGKYLGIYALEEHFGKYLIENSNYREGAILRISDQDKRNGYIRMSKLTKDWVGSGISWEASKNNSDISTFNSSKIEANKKNVAQFELGRRLLDQYLQNKLKTREVFDIKKTAKYFAISDILQAHGANTWYDMRFYFDPISARLMPIGYDAQIKIINDARILSIDQNVLKIFDDPVFVKEYISSLDELTKNNYIDKFFKHIKIKLKKESLILNKSFPFVRIIKDEFYKNNLYIRNRLNPESPIGINFIKLSNKENSFALEIFNKYKLPLRILSVKLKDKKYIPTLNNILNGKDDFKRVNNQIIDFKLDKKYKLDNRNKGVLGVEFDNTQNLYDLTLFYKLNGKMEIKSTNIKAFRQIITPKIEDRLITRNPTHQEFNSLIDDKKNKIIFIKDNIIIKKPLVLPANYKLKVREGVNLILKDEGLIFVQGALLMEGSKDKKIIVKSETGAKGILVLNSKEYSDIKHTIFDSLKPNTNDSLNITGGLTFYNSPVKIKDTNFLNSQGEDAINLVRSPFNIKNLFFKNIYSDAIDVDFSDGEIVGSEFINIGNDAIDISGANVLLNQIVIKKVGDKAISVGERGNLKVNDLKISNAFIGLASKDLSSTFINNIYINNVKICLAAYKKKEEYGPGFIKLKEEIPDCKSSYKLEKGSSIVINKKNLLPNSENTYDELYKNDM